MKKQVIGALLLTGMLLMNGCADSSSSGKQTPAASSSSAAETSSTADSSSSADSSSEAAPVYDYEHSTDGYFNLLDECKQFRLKTQQAGTCWLYAGRSSLALAYEKATGKELTMEIPDMLEAIYRDDKQEGFFVKQGIDKAELGGWQTMITAALSRGYKDGLTLESTVDIDPSDHEAIKNALRTRGAIAAETLEEPFSKGIFGKYYTLTYTKQDSLDHDVTIVGYDDHFPKEYFTTPASQDGAWIVYNSNLGEMLCYISYDAPFGYTFSHTVSDKYSDVLSYDAGNEMDRYIKTGDTTKTANVFHKKGKLAAVGTFNDFGKQDIKIEIMSADLKNVIYTQDAVLDFKGYHTIELTKPVDVEDYAVVITYSKGASVEGETIGHDSGKYKTVSEKGQSFVFVNSAWKDLTDADAKTVLKTGFAPGNACIKALYIK